MHVFSLVFLAKKLLKTGFIIEILIELQVACLDKKGFGFIIYTHFANIKTLKKT
jgi:hypothetical protein